MFGTVAHNLGTDNPVYEGPENNPVLREANMRKWMQKQALNEERLEFNKNFPAINSQFVARHDRDFILPDAYSQLMPVPRQPELHGMYSIPMIGSTVPGYVDPRLRNVGLVNNSDLITNNLERGTGSIAAVPRVPGLGDKLSNQNVLNALKKMLFKGTADDKDINAREMDRFTGRPWRGF